MAVLVALCVGWGAAVAAAAVVVVVGLAADASAAPVPVPGAVAVAVDADVDVCASVDVEGVAVAVGEPSWADAEPLSEWKLNGSACSVVGEASGEAGPRFPLMVPLRPVLLEEGEARRERVLRKLDLRFGGGSVCGSMGSAGSGVAGLASRSFWSSSTISIAARVRVRLWVGAKKKKGMEDELRFHNRLKRELDGASL